MALSKPFSLNFLADKVKRLNFSPSETICSLSKKHWVQVCVGSDIPGISGPHARCPRILHFTGLWVVLKQVILETHFYSFNKNYLNANYRPGMVENTRATNE